MSNNSFFSVMMIASVFGLCFFVWLAFDLEKADKLEEKKLQEIKLENAALRERLEQANGPSPLPSWPLDTAGMSKEAKLFLFRRKENFLKYER